jgi:hypothetical protein
MESKVENSTKGPESADKCESNTFTCLWLIAVSLLEQINVTDIGNNHDYGFWHFFKSVVEVDCFHHVLGRKGLVLSLVYVCLFVTEAETD